MQYDPTEVAVALSKLRELTADQLQAYLDLFAATTSTMPKEQRAAAELALQYLLAKLNRVNQ